MFRFILCLFGCGCDRMCCELLDYEWLSCCIVVLALFYFCNLHFLYSNTLCTSQTCYAHNSAQLLVLKDEKHPLSWVNKWYGLYYLLIQITFVQFNSNGSKSQQLGWYVIIRFSRPVDLTYIKDAVYEGRNFEYDSGFHREPMKEKPIGGNYAL